MKDYLLFASLALGLAFALPATLAAGLGILVLAGAATVALQSPKGMAEGEADAAPARWQEPEPETRRHWQETVERSRGQGRER